MSRRGTHLFTTAVAVATLVLAQGVAAAGPRTSGPGSAQVARLRASTITPADGTGDRGDDDDLAANLQA